MTAGKVLRRLADQQPAVFSRHQLRPTRCILATSVGLDVLAAFGIDARPLSVRVDLFNQALVDWIDAGRPGGIPAAEAAGGWWLTAGDGRTAGQVLEGKRWDGHLVVHVPGQGLLLDLDLQQMNRPLKGIAVPDVGVFPFDGLVGAYSLPAGGSIRYEARPADQSYQAGRDWWDTDQRRPLVDEVIRAVRKGRL